MSLAAYYQPGHPILVQEIEPHSEVPGQQLRSGMWVVAFVGCLLVFQIALFFLGSTSIRLPLRIGGYATSMGMLVLLNGRGIYPPAGRWALTAVGILLIQLLNPSGDTMVSRLAQMCLYAAVLAPLLWVGRLQVDRRIFRIVLLSFWGFYTLSASFGALQVEFPGPFDGALSANYDGQDWALSTNMFTLADGRQVLRPKGLSDNPGGAGAAGVYCIILGMGVLITSRSLVLRAIAMSGMGVGLFSIYICQGRTNLLMVGATVVIVLFVLNRRGATGRAMLLGYMAVGIAMLGSSMAFLIGGKSTIDRFSTLVAEDAGTVYQSNRGQFLDELIQYDIYDFPLGAGLGHWGMMNSYFGSTDKKDYLWAEMLWQALVFDGGIPLIVAYLGLFASLFLMTWKYSIRQRDNELTYWAIIIFAYNFAAFGASFSFPIMSQQPGMELTLMNACLFCAITAEARPLSPIRHPRREIGLAATTGAGARPNMKPMIDPWYQGSQPTCS